MFSVDATPEQDTGKDHRQTELPVWRRLRLWGWRNPHQSMPVIDDFGRIAYFDLIKTPIKITVMCVIMAGLVAASPDIMAAQTDTRLDTLFDRLQTASSVNEATTVTNLIWAIWHQSDNQQVNELMQTGLAEMSQRNYQAAIKTFSDMIAAEPDFAEGWNKRATVYYLLGDYRASVKDIDRTLELEPRHFGALSGLGLIMMAIDNDEAALQAFEATLAVNPFADGARENIRQLEERQRKRSF